MAVVPLEFLKNGPGSQPPGLYEASDCLDWTEVIARGPYRHIYSLSELIRLQVELDHARGLVLVEDDVPPYQARDTAECLC